MHNNPLRLHTMEPKRWAYTYKMDIVFADNMIQTTVMSNEKEVERFIEELCVCLRCIIFHIHHATFIPELLKSFLYEEDNVFVGVAIHNDRRRLQEDYIIKISNPMDLLVKVAEVLNDVNLHGRSLQRLAQEVLGVDVPKDKNITCGAWDAYLLTKEQVQYAFINAFVSYEMG
ncbi:unnamed protein product [Urochloa decumbens]|uniref:3'-5' exonuclease domain-containing protein n=1 Tax=Urochloa decumbens TaxID=240449 RepID=A0ABC9G972_9POAL